MSSSRRNPYACIDLKDIEKLQKKANQGKESLAFKKDSLEEKLWLTMEEINNKSKAINSCDLPNDDPDYSSIVLSVQQYYEVIFDGKQLEKYKNNKHLIDFDYNKASVLEKIQKVAAISYHFRAGNCQEKAFYGFNALLSSLIEKKISTFSQAVPLKLAYFNNHFTVIVANQFLFDPWLSIAYSCNTNKPLIPQIENFYETFGDLKVYFEIDENWTCSHDIAGTGNIKNDAISTQYTFTFFPNEYNEYVDSQQKSYQESVLKLSQEVKEFPPVSELFEDSKMTNSTSSENTIVENTLTETLEFKPIKDNSTTDSSNEFIATAELSSDKSDRRPISPSFFNQQPVTSRVTHGSNTPPPRKNGFAPY